jgi:hypothetical protein
VIAIREADLSRDSTAIVGVLGRYLRPETGGRRFDWLYRESPGGQARVWLVHDEGETVGVAAAFPRLMVRPSGKQRGWVLGDFCLAPQHRSLGAALRLQRTMLEAIAPSDPWYDFPSAAMQAVYGRLGLRSSQFIRRMVKRLRVDDKLEIIPGRQFRKLVATPANLLLRMTEMRPDMAQVRVETHSGAIGDEFTSLADEIGADYGDCVYRSADHVTWRYLRHPLRSYSVLTARRGAALVAYAVVACTADEVRIADLFGHLEVPVVAALIGRIVRGAREGGALLVTAPLCPGTAPARVLRRLGFLPREAAPVIAGNGPRQPVFFLTDGDRES